jgi:hypothetical protein
MIYYLARVYLWFVYLVKEGFAIVWLWFCWLSYDLVMVWLLFNYLNFVWLFAFALILFVLVCLFALVMLDYG